MKYLNIGNPINLLISGYMSCHFVFPCEDALNRIPKLLVRRHLYCLALPLLVKVKDESTCTARLKSQIKNLLQIPTSLPIILLWKCSNN